MNCTNQPYEDQASAGETRHRTCWAAKYLSIPSGRCDKDAIIRDWTGYEFCLKHWFQNMKFHAEGRIKSYWFYIKTSKFL